MIQSVLSAIPSYSMSLFLYPKQLYVSVNGLFLQFWRGGDAHQRKLHWVSWQRSCSSKSRGGLGFRDFKKFNLAYLAKQGWRLFHNQDSLWTRLWKGIYFPRSSFWQATPKRGSSWICQNMLVGQDVLCQGAQLNISDGTNTQLWIDPWIPLISNFIIPQPAHCPIAITKVADVIDHQSLS